MPSGVRARKASLPLRAERGSVYLRKDGRWEGAVHIGYENGKRFRRFVIGKTGTDAVAKLAPLLQARDEHRPVPSQRDKLRPFLRKWLDEVARPTLVGGVRRDGVQVARGQLLRVVRRALGDVDPERRDGGRRSQSTTSAKRTDLPANGALARARAREVRIVPRGAATAGVTASVKAVVGSAPARNAE